MALIDHLTRCNRWTPGHFHPFWIGGAAVGQIHHEIALRLRDFPDLFVQRDRGVSLSDAHSDPAGRSAALRAVSQRLAEDGLIAPLRGEDYRVVADWGDQPLLQLDRAAIPAFGCKAFGIHLNGVVQRREGLFLWIGKRAAGMAVEPGKLDNMVAGGQPVGLSLRDNLLKEAAEEAGIAPALAGSAIPVGAITYCMEEGFGLKRDTLFLYDLAMPDGVIPVAVDGEVEHFTLRATQDLVDQLRQGFAFKFNVALVLIDFMLRRGLLSPDDEPDYLALVEGLHRDISGDPR
jgi:8-oxo-dGTP pyrophosphatase MutT (NUDIX family)